MSTSQTEVERFVRDRVAATGTPCLMAPPGRAPSLRAVPASAILMNCNLDVFLLFAAIDYPLDLNRAAFEALAAAWHWVPKPPAGVSYHVEEGDAGLTQQVEATPLGLSLLQLALNRAGSGLVIEARP